MAQPGVDLDSGSCSGFFSRLFPVKNPAISALDTKIPAFPLFCRCDIDLRHSVDRVVHDTFHGRRRDLIARAVSRFISHNVALRFATLSIDSHYFCINCSASPTGLCFFANGFVDCSLVKLPSDSNYVWIYLMELVLRSVDNQLLIADGGRPGRSANTPCFHAFHLSWHCCEMLFFNGNCLKVCSVSTLYFV